MTTSDENKMVKGFCYSCVRPFEYDPATAPSVLVDAVTGEQIPAGWRVEPDEPRPESWQDKYLCGPCAETTEATARTLGMFPVWPARQAQQVSE